MDLFLLEPKYKNAINFFKLKTLIWMQILKKNNKIPNTDNIKNIYLIIEDIDKIKVNKIKENNLNNDFVLYLIFENYNFIYSFNILEKTTNFKEKNFINIDEDLDKKKTFVYPNVLYFIKKIKNEIPDFISFKKITINPIIFFKQELMIKKIKLIDKKKYEKISFLQYSKYENKVLKVNSIESNDITFNLFYFKNYLNMEDIYGFIYYYTDMQNLYNLDYRLK